MYIANVCKTLQLCNGTLTFPTTAALPPPMFDINLEPPHTSFLEYMVVFIGSIPPPTPTVPKLKYLMNLFPLQPAVYHGRNVFQDLIKSHEKFWNVKSK